MARITPLLQQHRTWNRVGLLTLVVGLGLALLLGGVRASALRSIAHDDAISFQVATAHQGAYFATAPASRWVEAAAWKAYWQPDGSLRFGTIARDLAEYDIHPPLYFWLLHVWLTIVGVHLWVGPALNLVLLATSGLLLFSLGVQILPNKLWSSLLVMLWALSPLVSDVIVETRPYMFLALWSILFIYLVVLWHAGRQAWWLWVGLALCAAAGLLTHFQYAVLLGAAAMLIMLRSARAGDVKRAARPLLAILVGAGLFAVIHPGFWLSLARQRMQTEACHPGELPDRILRAWASLIEFIAPPGWLLPVSATLVLLAIGVVLLRHRWPAHPPGRSLPLSQNPLAFLMAWLLLLLAAIVLLYLLCFTAFHAMGAKYLAMALPLLALTPFALLSGVKRRIATPLLMLLCLWQLAYAVQSTGAFLDRARPGVDPRSVLRNAPAVVLDTTARGVLPVVVWHLSDETPIYADSQEELLRDTSRFLAGLAPGAIYISDLRYGNTIEQQSRLLRAMEASGWNVEPFAGSVFGVGVIFVIQPSQGVP